MNWNSIILTYILAAFHVILCVLAILLTRYPEITVFHLTIALHVLNFVLRPLLAGLVGGFLLYKFSGDWGFYNQGLLYEFIFALAYVLGYFILYQNFKYKSFREISNMITKGAIFSLTIGSFTVLLIHILSNGRWLANVRSVAITRAIPYGAILFRVAVITLSGGSALALLALRKKRNKVLLLALALMAFLFLILLYQRGFVLIIMVVLLFVTNRLRLRIGYYRLIGFSLLIFVSIYTLRPLSIFVTTGHWKTSFLKSLHLIQKILYSPTFDKSNVWPIAIEYVSNKGLLLGKSILMSPLTIFLPPALRQSLGMFKAADYLNEFYQGEKYWVKGFGFNVSLSQELFINFGIIGLLWGIIPGLLTALLDRWLWRFESLNVENVYFVFAAFFSGGFTGSPIPQWFIIYSIFGFFISTLLRLRFPLFSHEHYQS